MPTIILANIHNKIDSMKKNGYYSRENESNGQQREQVADIPSGLEPLCDKAAFSLASF